MNEKYATLSLVQLKELAKSQGVKNVSTMRKAQLVQLMGELEEKYNKEKNEARGEQEEREKNVSRAARETKERHNRSEIREEKSRREKNDAREEKRNDKVEEKRGDKAEDQGTEDGEMRMDSSLEALDSGQMAHGILEVLADGYGFIRCENYRRGRMTFMFRRLRSGALI